MRIVALLALVALAGACRSRGAPSEDTEPKRSYLAENRQGIAYLKETYREGRKDRRANRRATLAFRSRRPANRYQEREGRKFAWEFLFGDEIDNARRMVRGTKNEVLPKRGTIRRSWRFLFVDRGE